MILSLNSAAIVRAAVLGLRVCGRRKTRHADHRHVLDRPGDDKGTRRGCSSKRSALGRQPIIRRIPKAATGELTLMQGGAEGDVQETQDILSKLAGNQTQ